VLSFRIEGEPPVRLPGFFGRVRLSEEGTTNEQPILRKDWPERQPLECARHVAAFRTVNFNPDAVPVADTSAMVQPLRQAFSQDPLSLRSSPSAQDRPGTAAKRCGMGRKTGWFRKRSLSAAPSGSVLIWIVPRAMARRQKATWQSGRECMGQVKLKRFQPARRPCGLRKQPRRPPSRW
jgi:hypothetical protein